MIPALPNDDLAAADQLPARVPAPPPIEAMLLEPKDDVEADRISWVIAQLAGDAVVPSVDRPWRGRAEIVKRAAQDLGLLPDDAGALVDKAVRVLVEGKREKNNVARVRLLEERLRQYRVILMQAIKGREKGYETVYEAEYKRNPDGSIMLDNEGVPQKVELLKRRRTDKGFDSMAFKLLLDLEELEARLHHLGDEEDTTNAFAELFERIEQDTQTGDVKSTKVVSLSQKLSRADLAGLGKVGREVMEKAVRAKEGRSKRVAARVTTKAAAAKQGKGRKTNAGDDGQQRRRAEAAGEEAPSAPDEAGGGEG